MLPPTVKIGGKIFRVWQDRRYSCGIGELCSIAMTQKVRDRIHALEDRGGHGAYAQEQDNSFEFLMYLARKSYRLNKISKKCFKLHAEYDCDMEQFPEYEVYIEKKNHWEKKA